MTHLTGEANFSIVDSNDSYVIIKDLGPWDQHPTVTNDAEGVVKRIVLGGYLRLGQRLYYSDSEGDVDELLVRDGKFAGFSFGGPKGARG